MKSSALPVIIMLIIACKFIVLDYSLPAAVGLDTTSIPDYRLEVSQDKIPLLKDTVFNREKCLITYCPATLYNNTNDTLKYIAMSASWWDYYTLDNHAFSLAADYWNVFKNGEMVIEVPPHQWVTRSIGIITYKANFRGEKLRIAMNLRRVRFGFPEPKANNLLWSNEVEIR